MLYLERLANRADAICIQEHWLHHYEKHALDELLPDFICFTKCHDDDQNTDPIERRRGFGGVALCIHKKYEKYLTPIVDGGDRVVGVMLNTRKPLLLLSVYLPCRGNTLDTYNEVIDELYEIVKKYGNNTTIMIGGDMNASLRRDTSQDKIFKSFLKENNLSVPLCRKDTFTFYHYNGRDCSQIDYFISNFENIIDTYMTFTRESINTSTHDPILVTLRWVMDLKLNAESVSARPRVNWKKLDTKEYETEIEKKLSEWISDDLQISNNNLHSVITDLCHILADATSNHSNLKRTKRKKTTKKRLWNPEIKLKEKACKDHFARWKAAGRPKDPENIYFRNMKTHKKLLRSAQRQLEAKIRVNRYTEIMDLHEGNNTGFYSLIRKQRDPKSHKSSYLIFDNKQLQDESEIREAWADYFTDLATPVDSPNFDNEYKEIVEKDIQNMTNLFTENRINNIELVTADEMKEIIWSFKSGKSPDEENICVEHFKYGGSTLMNILTLIVNHIFINLDIPNVLKSGIACPILKKGKPSADPDSYRKITITNTIGKIVEKVHLKRNNMSIMSQQSKLQKGFTQGQMPTIAALILTELITEYAKRRSPLYVAFMDARKAFDVLWHMGLLKEMNKFGLHNNNWLFFHNWYENVTSKIKWHGEISRSIDEKQGVRQGGIWSPTAYKIFVDSLLKSFEQNQLGACIGTVFCGIPTVADDVTLITTSPYELQSMLDVQADYANKQRYLLSEQKSSILVFNDKPESSNVWTINDKPVTVSKSATHLGIIRNSSSTSNKELVNARIQTARRTVYSLLGAGLHGLNGVNPKIAIHLIQIYVLPRLMYGLEVVNINNCDVQHLEIYYRKLLKQIQHLPERTSTSAVYLLLGKIPIEGELHKKMLKTFGNIIRNENSIEREIAIRQLAIKCTKSGSWFPKIVEIAEKYDLPSLHDLLENPPSKYAWNKLVNIRIQNYYFSLFDMDVKEKSTLKYIHFTEKKGVHNIWESCETDARAIAKACIKVKIATGTIILQEKKAKFSKGTVSPLCPLCNTENEDIHHFILKCPQLEGTRNVFTTALSQYVSCRNLESALLNELINSDENFLQLIMDCTVFYCFDNEEKKRIETLSRGMCYRLYQERSAYMNSK